MSNTSEQICARAQATKGVALEDAPQVVFDCTRAINEATDDQVRGMLEQNLKGCYETDILLISSQEERAIKFVELLDLAYEFGADFGGYDVVVLDRKKFVAWLKANRPEVFTDELLDNIMPDLRQAYKEA